VVSASLVSKTARTRYMPVGPLAEDSQFLRKAWTSGSEKPSSCMREIHFTRLAASSV
jgi:hypothetical protein